MSFALPESLWEMVEPLGWVLVHFVWQGILIGIGLACALAAMRQGSAKWRYCASLLALGGMGVMPFVTLAIPALSRPFPAQERIAEVSVQPTVEVREVAEPIPEVATREFDVEDSGIEFESDIPMEGRGEFEEVAAGVPPSVETKLGAEVKSVGLKERIAETAMRLRPWLKLLVACWLAGVLFLSFRLVRMWNRVQRLRCVGVEEVPDPLVSRLEELARRLGLRMRVNLLLSQLVEVPTLIGWLRPVILLPAAAVTGLTPSQLDAILVHELAHIRRHDYLVNLMQSSVETLLFYHPAVWWVSGRLRVERENCCDDLTVEMLGDPINYGRALLALEEQRGGSTNPALVLGSQGGSLLGRIERLVVRSNGRGRSTMGTSMSVLVGMLMLSCATMLMVRGEIHSERVVKDAEASDARVENQNEDSERSDSSDPISKLIEHEGVIWGPEKGGLRSALVIVPDKGIGAEFFDSHPLKKNWRVIQLIENVGKEPVQISNGPFDAELDLIDEKDESKRLVPLDWPHLAKYENALHPGRFDQFERMKLRIETLKEGETPLYQSEMGRVSLSLPPGKYRLKLTAPGVDTGLSEAEKESATRVELLETVPLEFELEREEANKIDSTQETTDSKVDKEGAEGESKSLPEYQFRIVDSQGKPVVGAKVTPVSVSAGAGSMSVTDAICTATISDQKGKAHLKFKIDLAAKAIRIPLFEIQEFLILGETAPPSTGLYLRIEHPEHPVWNGYFYPNGDKPIVLADSSSVSIRGHRANSDAPLERLYPVLKGRANWSQERGILTLKNLNLSGEGGERWLQVVHVPEEGAALYGDLIDLAALKDKLAEPIEVELKPGVRVTGAIDPRIPRPIRNGFIRGQITEHRGAVGFSQMSIKQAIEPDGTFVIESLPQGTDLQIVALCEGWVSRTPSVTELKEYGERYGFANLNFDERNNTLLIGQFVRLEGDSVSPVIAMVPTTTCEVTVLDRDEAPLPGVAINVFPSQLWHDMGSNMLGMGGDSLEYIRARLEDPTREISPARLNGPTSYRGETDSQGRVTISGLPSQIDPNGRKIQFAYTGGKIGYRFSNGLLYGPIQSMEIRRGEQGKITLHMEPDPQYRASAGESKPAEHKPNPAPEPEAEDEKPNVGGDGKVVAAAAGLTAETVVARVGETEIRAYQLYRRTSQQMKDFLERIEKLRSDPSPEAQAKARSDEKFILDRIESHLRNDVEILLLSLGMEDYLRELDKQQADVIRQEIDEQYKTYMNEQALFQYRFLNRGRKEIFAELFAKKFCALKLALPPAPTSDRLRGFYESHQADYLERAKVRWQSILIKVDQHGGEESARKRAAEAVAALRGGRAFAEVAGEYSDGFNAKSGGNWGWTARGSMSDQTLEKMLFELPVNETSDVVSTANVLQIVKVLERQPEGLKPLEEVTPFVRKEFLIHEYVEAYDKLIAECRQKHPVWTMQGELQTLPRPIVHFGRQMFDMEYQNLMLK